jgi:hypothetical protein
MLKTLSNFVLGRSPASTYKHMYASASKLPAASLDDRFEHPGGFQPTISHQLGADRMSQW